MASIDGKRRFQVLFRGSESGFMGAINGFVVGAPMKQLHGIAIGFGPLQDAGGALVSRTEIVELSSSCGQQRNRSLLVGNSRNVCVSAGGKVDRHHLCVFVNG